VLRNGTEFGPPISSGAAIKTTTITLNAPTRVDGASLTLAVDAALVSKARPTLRRVLMITGVIALAVSAVVVAAAVRVALRPLEEMAGLAKTISQGSRGYRLAPARTDTELGQTAQAFDEMLDELEGAERRAQQAEECTRAFLADAAHELRTPIARVQAAAETMLHHDDQLDRDERQHLQALLVREAERAGALISGLLAAAGPAAGIDLDLAPISLRTLVHSELHQSEHGSSSGWYDLIMVEQEMRAAPVSGWRSHAATPGTGRGSQLQGATRQRRHVPAHPPAGTAAGGSPLGNRSEHQLLGLRCICR
jgi:two-component system, OmpR family, sensor kinase